MKVNMETRNYWEETGRPVSKYDHYNSNDGFGRVGGEQLNFAAPSEDEAEYPPSAYLKKGKVSRQDPMSHRIIEKRRRDRMNNCLADLSRLIPPEYLKKGRGRVEKTEIIEMAIRHLKFLQERANSSYGNPADRQVSEEHFRAGYQEAVAEVLRFLVDLHGYGPGDGLCAQLAGHMQRHCEAVTKGSSQVREKHPRSHPGSSSETTSSSGSSYGYAMKPGVIAQAPPPAPPAFVPEYDERPPETYQMECDRVSGFQNSPALEGDSLPEEPLPLDGRCKREPTLRTVRKPEHTEDYLHSYKFKNSIERRFSRSQDTEAATNGKVYGHKRRRAAKPVPSASTSQSGSTEDAPDTSPQDTSSESPHHHHHYDKPPTNSQYVPIFALNAAGKYYVPLSVEYSCVWRGLRASERRGAAPLHPVTIHVDFQPCLSYHVKREPSAERELWRPA